jgi:hypothetical protein
MSHQRLSALIEASYTMQHAEQFLQETVTAPQVDILSRQCNQVLYLFPVQPFCCSYMSAMLVALAQHNGLPCYLVAGSLYLRDICLFKYDNRIETSNINLDWAGHCWAVLNNLIIDVSLFRTAYLPQSPILLRDLIVKAFGKENIGGIIAAHTTMRTYGLSYQAEYVFTDDQVTGLRHAADLIISNNA